MNDFRTIVAALVTASSLALALHLIQAHAADEALPPPGKLAQKGAPGKAAVPATKAGPPAAEAPASSTESHALDQKILNLRARLAEIDWQKAVDSNKQVPGTFTADEIDRRLAAFKFAQQRADQAKAGSGAQASQALRLAQANLKVYEIEYQKALAANKNSADAVPPLEVERLKLQADLGRLQVAREQSTGSGQMVASHMTAGLEELREEVQNLRSRVEQLEEHQK